MAVALVDALGLRAALMALLVASLVIIATALGFEHFGGYAPCPLCLQERYAYYFAIAGCLVALALPGRMARALLALICIGFLINTGIAAYHSGAEWKFWPGPSTCSGGLAPLSGGGSLADRLDTPVIRCDEAPWRLLGLSFAGWNGVLSLTLFAFSALAVLKASPRTH